MKENSIKRELNAIEGQIIGIQARRKQYDKKTKERQKSMKIIYAFYALINSLIKVDPCMAYQLSCKLPLNSCIIIINNVDRPECVVRLQTLRQVVDRLDLLPRAI